MAVIGPGAVKQEQLSPTPTLEGASEYEVVEILNPLTDDFSVQVAQSKPVPVPIKVKDPVHGELGSSEVARIYGANLKNNDYVSKVHVLNTTVIPAGKTMKFRGDVAQVVVRQLIAYILQKENRKLRIGDPVARKEVEDRIIISRGSIEDLMDNRLQSHQVVIDKAINEANNEKGFPGLDQERARAGDNSSSDSEADPEKPSRTAKKAN